jgi:hypothetical protein
MNGAVLNPISRAQKSRYRSLRSRSCLPENRPSRNFRRRVQSAHRSPDLAPPIPDYRRL